jgi:hypothetical protein
MAETQASHRQTLERRALSGDLIKAMMGTILAYITFAGAMGGAVYLLAHDKPLYGLAALVTALALPSARKSTPTSFSRKARNHLHCRCLSSPPLHTLRTIFTPCEETSHPAHLPV